MTNQDKPSGEAFEGLKKFLEKDGKQQESPKPKSDIAKRLKFYLALEAALSDVEELQEEVNTIADKIGQEDDGSDS